MRAAITRKRIFEIIDNAGDDNRLNDAYDWAMMICILLSIFPLAFKEEHPAFQIIEHATVAVFIIDYALRLMTADYKYPGKGMLAFVRYPFSPMAVIDLISILPSVTALNSSFRLLRTLRLVRTMKVMRIFKAVRYSRSLTLIKNTVVSAKHSLMAVCVLALTYILVCALAIFNVEPESFDTFFDAVYWATVSLTTIGYGDIYAVTVPGRIITMISSIFGIAVIALPASIITAGYMNALRSLNQENGDEDKK